MSPRCGLLFLLVTLIAGSTAWHAIDGQETPDKQARTPTTAIERLLEAVAAGKEPEANAADRIPDLISLVETGEPGTSDLALRALAAFKDRAAPAVATICRKLSDPSHATRGLAIDAVVAIGDASVAPLRNLTKASSGRTRAAATYALGRLKVLDLSELENAAKDPDPRVRAAAASAVVRFGKSGVPLLAGLLSDPEPAVAVEAVQALKADRDDPSIAIPKLIEILSRSDRAWGAADGLAAYGVEARRAVPSILKAYPLGRLDRFEWKDAAEAALEHIGPPHELDIPQVCENLSRDDPEVRILAANSLALLGRAGQSAAPALEAAALGSVGLSLELDRKFAQRPDPWRSGAGRALVAAEQCAASLWEVTRDGPRIVALVEKLVLAGGGGFGFGSIAWREISPEDRPALDAMLRHPNSAVKQAGLSAFHRLESIPDSSRDLILELAQGPDAEVVKAAVGLLGTVPTNAVDGAEAVLIAGLREGTIPLLLFANAISRIGSHLRETQAILEEGLQDRDRWTALACARALCSTTNEPARMVKVVIDLAGRGKITHREAIGALGRLEAGRESFLRFLVEQLQSHDYWTRYDAASALGNIGPKAAAALAPLRTLLSDESIEMRLKAAQAMFLIVGDPAALEQQLAAVFAAADDRPGHYQAIVTIAELKQAGAPFLRFVTLGLREAEPQDADRPIEALEAIGTPEAISVLRTTAGSSDWILKSLATKALKRSENRDGK